MTVKEIINYFENAKEHYEISDEFVKSGYHQRENAGNYIGEARKRKLEVNKDKAEPNQKWHLLESYIQLALDDPNYSMTLETKFPRRYNILKCPELLLWIAEAAGVDKEKVQKAANKAKQAAIEVDQFIDSGISRHAGNEAVKKIRQEIPWEEIENCIKKQK